ncbi:putative ubiquitin-conjugating enzyme E2 [Dissostichus eleginoides]|uniref:Ubiquitin-conjugating enzyme E2 n=1 Tax=Dissostichus eleginoides TaxID=100907 RepID=A0AAD9C3E2_DISEL|nr:putative ubiquitin-conjugating enzyme E2 [Dissostichus eleginoides]
MAAAQRGLAVISYHGSGEGGESDDSEGENQELAQIDRERRRNCALTPLATSQQHNQGPLSPARLRRLRLLLDANLDRHSSEEELERISCGDNRKWVSAIPQRHGDHHSSTSSDEEVRDVFGCGSPAASARPLVESNACLAASPSPVLFSSSPPRSLKPPPMRFQLQVVQPVVRPIILTHFEQSAPYRKYRHSYGGEAGRPSLDLEKMQQKMLLKKNCGGKTRTIKMRNLTGSRPPPQVHLRPLHLRLPLLEYSAPLQSPDPVRGSPPAPFCFGTKK